MCEEARKRVSEWAGRRVGFYCFHSSHSSTGTGNGFAVPPLSGAFPTRQGRLMFAPGAGPKPLELADDVAPRAGRVPD